jgi:hypothetical protein
MKTLGKLAIVASVMAGLGAATVAQAHGIWFAQRSNQLALIYGDQGLNLVVATLATPPANPAITNRDEHLATLSFVLPHLPE